jgi:hypothetical protein
MRRWWIVLAVVGAGLVAIFVNEYPAMVRYLKIEKM